MKGPIKVWLDDNFMCMIRKYWFFKLYSQLVLNKHNTPRKGSKVTECVLHHLCCRNTVSQTRKKASVLGQEVRDQGICGADSFQGLWERICSKFLAQLLLLCWKSLASPHSLSSSSHYLLPVCLAMSKLLPSLIRTPAIFDLGLPLHHNDLILSIISAVTLFPCKVTPWGTEDLNLSIMGGHNPSHKRMGSWRIPKPPGGCSESLELAPDTCSPSC